MKKKRDPRRKRAKIQASKKRTRYITMAIAVLIVIVIISSYILLNYSNPSSNQNDGSTLTAAIIDHLSLTVPNRQFSQEATSILRKAGYTVDYYIGEEVTVEFYRTLPQRGYDLIILRIHSALESYDRISPLVFFTSESYSSTNYVLEQLQDQVGAVAYSTEEAERGIMYFGIKPSFVRSSMKGSFNSATIIMMGCDGLKYQTMAEAFIEKGAEVYVGWNGGVSASHTDEATKQLLTHLVTEKQTVELAVSETMREVGPDPAKESILQYYPV